MQRGHALHRFAGAQGWTYTIETVMAYFLVSGVAGFIGSNVARLLLEQGNRVRGVDNFNDSCDPRLKHWRVDQLRQHPEFELSELDVADRDAVRAFTSSLEAPRAVIHLAARAGVRPSVRDPWTYYDSNVIGTLNMLNLCLELGTRKFVFASSSSVYGDAAEAPFQEDMDTDHPLSPYAASKKAAENLCYSYHHLHGLDITVFRYFTVYGPAGRPDMSPYRFVQWIAEGRPVTVYGDGTQSRDFTYVADVARGTVVGLQSVGYGVFNLGSDSPVVLMDFIRQIEQKLGKPAKLIHEARHAADVTRTWANIERAKSILGWQPQVTLSQGLTELVLWYRRERDWAKEIPTG